MGIPVSSLGDLSKGDVFIYLLDLFRSKDKDDEQFILISLKNGSQNDKFEFIKSIIKSAHNSFLLLLNKLPSNFLST